MTAGETAIPVGPKSQLQYLVSGNQLVVLSSSKGVITCSTVKTLDAVLSTDTQDSSSTVEQLTQSSGALINNTVTVYVYTNTLSGPTEALRSGSSLTIFYSAIGH